MQAELTNALVKGMEPGAQTSTSLMLCWLASNSAFDHPE